MDGPRAHHAKWDKSKTNSVQSHLHVEYKKTKLIIYNCQDMEATDVSRWMDKEDMRYTHTHTHNALTPSHKKEWNFAICSNVDGIGGHYAKWNRSKYTMILYDIILYDINYMRNVKNITNYLYNKKEAVSNFWM